MKTALMFSGQGAQFPGMMQDIVTEYRIARELFDLASTALGRDIYSLTMESSQEKLNLTQNTQPCLLACELAVLRIIRSIGLDYEAALGFSLGEWAALAAAGAASEEEVIKLIDIRAAAMQQAVPEGKGGMVSILGMDAEAVAALCREVGDVSPANYNCPGNITVAGTAEALGRLLERAEKTGIIAAKVAVSIPSHCSLMLPAAERLRPLINAAAFHSPDRLLIMNATAKPVVSCGALKDALIQQLTSPVLFQQSILYLLEDGYDTFIEVGPGKVLSGMVRRTAKQTGKRVRTLQANSLAGLEKLSSCG